MGVSLSLKWEVGDKKLASYFNMRFDSKVSTSEIKQSFKEVACISKKKDIYTFNGMYWGIKEHVNEKFYKTISNDMGRCKINFKTMLRYIKI